MEKYIIPGIKGVCVAIFLNVVLGWNIDDYHWWVGMLTLNTMVNL